MAEHRTKFGTVTINDGSVVVTATQDQLYAWSHRPGAAWPLSTLDDCDEVAAWFTDTGLVDLLTVVDGKQDEVDIAGDELNAWTSDVLRDVLPKTHPAYFVTVGQFDR
jgi:hypothetical protein